MKTLPWFPCFPDDYLSSPTTARMTLEEQGAYWRLLCYGWSMDGIPNDPRELALLLGLDPVGEKASTILRRVIDLAWKVDADDPRKLRNDRQETERAQSSARYGMKLRQIAKARAANPFNRKKIRGQQGLDQGLDQGLAPQPQPHFLKKERSRKSEPEPQPQPPEEGKSLPADWQEIAKKLRPPRGDGGPDA